MTAQQKRLYDHALRVGPGSANHALRFLSGFTQRARGDGSLLRLCAVMAAIRFAHDPRYEKLRANL